MPIPAATSSDVLLCDLLKKQVDDFEAWIDLSELSSNPFKGDLEYLENHSLIECRSDARQLRLTPLGVFTALLFERIPDGCSV